MILSIFTKYARECAVIAFGAYMGFCIREALKRAPERRTFATQDIVFERLKQHNMLTEIPVF